MRTLNDQSNITFLATATTSHVKHVGSDTKVNITLNYFSIDYDVKCNACVQIKKAELKN